MDMNQYLSDLEYLVNIDSGPDCHEGQSKIAVFFKRRFDEIGWNTKVHDLSPHVGDCLVCTNRAADHYDLMLIGHIDTVFPRARCNERKGVIGFTVEFTGKAGHCGYVFTNGARSAVSEMARWIVKLDSLQSRKTDTTVNVGVAQGGMKSNVVAPNASIQVDIRIAANEELQRVQRTLEELTKEAKAGGIDVEIKNKRSRAALSYTEKSAAYVKHVEELTKSLGIEYKHRKRGGLSDANSLAQFGVVCLDAMGPAGDDDHSPDEYLLLDSVLPSFALSMALIKDLAQV